MQIRISICLIFATHMMNSSFAGDHFTVRLKQPKRWNSPRVELMQFSPDGRELAVATNRGTQFIRSRDGEVTYRTEFAPFAMAYSKDGSLFYSIARSHCKLLRVHDKYSLPLNFKRKPGYIGIRINERNGKLIISHVDPGSPADKAKLIHVGDELVGVGQGKSDEIISVVGKATKYVVRLLNGLPGTYVQLSFIPRGKLDPTVVRVMRAGGTSNAGRRNYREFEPPRGFDNVARCMVSGYHEFRSARTGRPVSAFRTENVNSNRGTAAISADSRFFAWIGQYRIVPGKAKLFSDRSTIDSRSVLPSSGTDAAQVAGSALDRNGLISSSVKYYGVEIYDIASREIAATFPIAVDPKYSAGLVFRGAHFSNDSKQFIVGTQSRLHVYDIASGKRTNEINLDPDATRPTVISSAYGNGMAAAGDYEGNVRLVDIAKGEVVQTISSRSEEEVTHAAMSSDGRKVAFHVDGVVHIVDIDSHATPGNVAAIN